jgi:hypothetical protein
VDDALRRRLDALIALAGLAVASLVALAGATSLAALAGALSAFGVGLAVWWVVAPLDPD